MTEQAVVEAEPVEVVVPAKKPKRGKPKRPPRYHVVLWNDDDHSFRYVVNMMQELFGHTREQGWKIAEEVDTQGKAICMTTVKEQAEFKCEQIQAYGKDKMIDECVGSMYSTIEAER